jgi:hypothetical protein
MKKSQSTRERSIGRAFAKDFATNLGQASTMTYADVVANLRDTQRCHLASLGRNRYLALELKRRIAEKLLEQALLHDCSLEECRSRLKSLNKLGFTDAEAKANSYLLYAKGASTRGHKRSAQSTATKVIRELESTLRRRKSRLGRQLLELAKSFLEQLRHS